MQCLVLFLVRTSVIPCVAAEICPLPPPCECDREETIVYCRNKNLTTIPPVTKADGLWSFHLGANKIKYIPSKWFSGVKLQMLFIDSNEIDSIDDDAFTGSEDSLNVLQLHDNSLRELPTAVGNLRKLLGITLQGNPLPDFRKDVLQNISSSLRYISMGSDVMPKWPDSLNYLCNLISINLYDVAFPNIPDAGFHAFRKNLTSLSLYNTGLTALPSLDDLDSLRNLIFQGNKNLTANAISNTVKSGLPNLMGVTFQDNNLKTLPNIFMKSPKLSVLNVYSEPMEYLRDETFPPNAFMTLSFNNTKFASVPFCVSSLSHVTSLQMAYNRITEISSEDFRGMTKLSSLDLSGNPITRVSKDAFMAMNDITYVRLDYTNLTTIPSAITNINALQVVEFSHSPILCTCESIGWIKHWKTIPANLQLIGYCTNIEMNLMAYIHKEVPKCLN